MSLSNSCGICRLTHHIPKRIEEWMTFLPLGLLEQQKERFDETNWGVSHPSCIEKTISRFLFHCFALSVRDSQNNLFSLACFQTRDNDLLTNTIWQSLQGVGWFSGSVKQLLLIFYRGMLVLCWWLWILNGENQGRHSFQVHRRPFGCGIAFFLEILFATLGWPTRSIPQDLSSAK